MQGSCSQTIGDIKDVKVSFCSPVYVVFGGPHNLPQIPNSFPAISMAADVIFGSKKLLWKCCIFYLLCCHWDSKETIGNLGLVVGSTKNCIYRATKRHLNIFDISSSLEVAPIWKWVHLFEPGSKIVLFANFHQFQIRIFTFDLIFGPETFVLSIFWRVTAQIRIERATQICFNFLDSSTGLVLTPHESWVPFLFPDRVSTYTIPCLRVGGFYYREKIA